jgi:Glycosyl hydrolase family 79 C-terminal beta domain
MIPVTLMLLLAAFAAPAPAQSGGSGTGSGTGSTVSANVSDTPSGQAMPPGFVGVSLEYGALHVYTGRDPRAVDPVLVALLRNLAPGQTPVLRIGGDSTDATWWPQRGVIPPAGVTYRLSAGWLRTTQALANALGAQMIMGVNLAAGRPALAAAEARALLSGIGRRRVEAIEIGNEPDVYNMFSWYHDKRGRAVFARGGGYNFATFTSQFSRWRAAMPTIPAAGPAFAELGWLSGLPRFLAAEPGLKLLTIHRYPLRAATSNATIPNLLSDSSSAGVAQSVAPYVPAAHARGIAFRVDEMNSASNSGQKGVSNTFASSLWVLDTLYNLAAVGVDGVNVHSLPFAKYELFSFSRPHGHWRAVVHPEYYGMLMFAQSFPPGSRILPVTQSSGPVKVWATRGSDGHTRVVLINKDPANSYPVDLNLPGVGGPATVEWLRAPSAGATSGVTWGGQTFGAQTTTGALPGPAQTQPVLSNTGDYSITLPPASAALLTQ